MEEVTSAPARARFGRAEVAIAALSAAFVVLAVLVAGGRLDSIDHYSVVHWMPGLDPAEARDTVPHISGVFMPFDLDAAGWHKLLDVVMYPASVLISFTVFAVGSLVLWRRGAKVAAVVWGATWFVANAIEVILKVAIAKPELYVTKHGVTHHLAAFDHSFPSGHALRAVLVAGILGYVWRRLGAVAAAWVVVVAFCLVAASWHVPSDVVGGILFGVIVVLSVHVAIAAANARRA